MKYVVYERSYKNGYFYYVSEAEVDKGAGDFPRNVLDALNINNAILGPTTTYLNPGVFVGYLLDGYDSEVYVFEEDVYHAIDEFVMEDDYDRVKHLDD